jgi:hypothetical protein
MAVVWLKVLDGYIAHRFFAYDIGTINQYVSEFGVFERYMIAHRPIKK